MATADDLYGSNGPNGMKVSRLRIVGNYSKSRLPFAEPFVLSRIAHAGFTLALARNIGGGYGV